MANPDDVKYFKKKFPEFDEEEIIEILDLLSEDSPYSDFINDDGKKGLEKSKSKVVKGTKSK